LQKIYMLPPNVTVKSVPSLLPPNPSLLSRGAVLPT
jgi:hypothetical protein